MSSLFTFARPLAVYAAAPAISTVAGSGVRGLNGNGQPATSAELNTPTDAVQDAAGNLYIADMLNHEVRKVDTSGNITDFAGDGSDGNTVSSTPQVATSVSMDQPFGLLLDSAGDLFIADQGFPNRIYEVFPNGTIVVFAGNGSGLLSGDGGPAVNAGFNPQYMVITPAGFFFTDCNNSNVRKIDSSGNISTVATGILCALGITADPAGNLYVSANAANQVDEIDTTGHVTVVAGTGAGGYSGDGGPATAATMNGPYGVAYMNGGLYISDPGNDVVREVDPAGTMRTVVGNGTAGYAGDGGPATSAELSAPSGLHFSANGDVYISDFVDQVIRKVAGLADTDLLSLTGAAPAVVVAGQAYAYTLTVRNPGGVGGATGVTVSDTLPAGVSFVSASATQGSCSASGSTVSCLIGSMAAGAVVTVTINVTAPNGSVSLTNIATVSANETDPSLGDNTATETTLDNFADLSVTASASTPQVVFGHVLTFTVTVHNAGAATATNVTVTNSLSAGLTVQSASASQGSCSAAPTTVNCSLGSLANGGQATVSIAVVPPQSVTSASVSATVSADQTDPNPANNTASDSARVALTAIHEFSSVPSGAQGLAFGPDGNVWVAGPQSTGVARMTTSGGVTIFPASDRDQQFITRGPDGNMWFTESQDSGASTDTQQGFIGRLTTSGQLTEFPLPTKFARPYAIAAGGDGNVWFTEDASRIGRLTPQGQVAEFPIPTQQPLSDAIALGPDGNMWFTESRVDKLARIDPQGHITEFDLPSGAGPEGLVTGPDHNLWIVESGSNNIAKFNITTHALTEYPIPTQNAEAEYIAVGPDSNLYFTEADFFNGSNQQQGIIGRISTSGVMLEIPIPNSQADEPWDIVAGPDGNMWFTEQFGHEVVSMAPPINVLGTQEKGTSSIVTVSAHQPPPIRELSLPETNGVSLSNTTRGADGNLYGVEAGNNAIVQIRAGGAVSEIPAPRGRGGTLAGGSDGNIWYCDASKGLDRLNPKTGVTTNFPLASGPPGACVNVVAGADGNLWYDTFVGNVGKMTTSGVATEYVSNDTPLPGAGPGGTIWGWSGTSFDLLKHDGTVAASYAIPDALNAENFSEQACTAVPDGNLWCTANIQVGSVFPVVVVRVNATTGAFDVFKTGFHPLGSQASITAAPDGNLWIGVGGHQTGPTAILAMNTKGQIVFNRLVPAGFASPNGVGVGPALSTGSKNGWAVYMAEAATNSYAVVQGVNGG